MIAIFARMNHPKGYGFTNGRAMGYSIFGVRCRTAKQLEKVISKITRGGCDLPDHGRYIYRNGTPETQPSMPSWFSPGVWEEGITRWYSGGTGDFEYLFTIPGNKVLWPDYKSRTSGAEPLHGSRGDFRFLKIYEAKEVLA